ncbi:MAG: DUF6452 family protein [Bacteroidales bacterium]
MRNYLSLTSFLLAGVILTVLSSCTPQACFDETEAFLKASFYDNTTKLQLAPDSLTLSGLGRDTALLYINSSGINPAQFPLEAARDSCTFIITINNITDSITFYYTNYPHLISKECGYTFFYDLIDTPRYTKNTIDYIYVNSKSITTSNEENIRIFY